MERKKEEQDGLSEIYLSPSRHFKQRRDVHWSSDTDHNEYSDTETWAALDCETTVTGDLHLSQETSMGHHQGVSLGLREEIEGGSSRNSSAVGTKNEASNEGQAENAAEEARSAVVSQLRETDEKDVSRSRGNVEGSGQRGETPGSDCPPVAGAFSRVLRQPLKLETNFPVSSNSELIFSPGGNEGFMVPGGVHAYYGSGSDTETSEWAAEGEGGAPALIPVRDAVEGADCSVASVRAYPKMPSGLEDSERNSPAGLSTPDADIDLMASVGRSLAGKKMKSNVRPPVVGQSEELLASRKDLGSTDGEESDNEVQRRMNKPVKTAPDLLSASEALQGSLGSQSENTDSVNTVLDMSRGEIQGCETDDIMDNPLLSPSLVSESSAGQLCPKPAFVVGGLMSPRGKLRQFQNTVRDRMQDVKASLELQPSSSSPVDRDQFLRQPSAYPPVASTSEQEVSLMSMISVESTNHPESSERVTSPSVLSVSSAASSRRMEWDSGADVGYSGNLAGSTHEHLVTSLSTLERIAIGNYASVLRTEPEGTTQVKEKQQRASKRSAKSSGAKAGSGSSASRKSAAEGGAASSPSRSHRALRDRLNLSSSDEDFGSRLSSPAQSPRRRPRKRAPQASAKEVESPRKGLSKRKQAQLRRLKEVNRELCSEGKSSSLMELARFSLSIPQCKRSSSQQSLSLPQTTYESADNGASNAAGDASSITTAAHQKNVSEGALAAPSTTNISTSTSTLVHSVSPVPEAWASASACSTLEREALKRAKGKKDECTPMIDGARHGTQPSVQMHDRESQASALRRTFTSRGTVSSKSLDSSDVETPPDMKDTDGESLVSYHLSDDEPVNLKARKNSENAKNHESLTKKCSQSAGINAEDNKCKEYRGNNSSGSLQLRGQRDSSSQDSESVLESQVSLLSSNNALQALSVKLKGRIQALIDNGSLKKVQDYNKLQDYINFIGIPSASEEESRLRHGVANVIMRMFGEIGLDDTDTSNTFNSETSEMLTTDSQISDQQPQNASERVATNSDDLAIALPCDSTEVADSRQLAHAPDDRKTVTNRQECAFTSGGTISIVPYHPPSATRTYFMAVSHECDEGLVEGKHSPTSKVASPLLLTPDSEQLDSRGYAEGQREDGEVIPSSAPPVHQLPEGDDYSNGDSNFEDPGIQEMETEPPKKSKTTKDQREDDSETPSLEVTTLPDWGISSKMEKVQGVVPPVVTSEDSSPQHTARRYAWGIQSNWQREEFDPSSRDSVNWWSATTRSERLYKDRRGTLHVANQPPGYMEDRESQPSESTSDHEHHQRGRDAESQEEARGAAARPWTSSGSESAYETIRERHRHVDEALASSFEFYSTSPWDTRLLGYVSSDAGRIQGPEEFEEQSQKEGSSEALPLPPSPSPSEGAASTRQARLRRHALRRQPQHQVGDRQNSSPSSQTDVNDVSSQMSFIQLQKQRYVRKIQRHIHTLEKLERALLVQLEDSIGSENSFRRCVTEGRSHTESDTTGRSQTRDILGQSETATSSIISSDYSDEMAQKQPYHLYRMGRLSKTKVMETLPDGQKSSLSNERKSESIKSTTGQSLLEQSQTSSPGLTLSRLSSDLTSSRASTLKHVEEEVRKLAHAEERSRHMMKSSRLGPSAAEAGGLQDGVRKMQREEPRGEEDPMQPRFDSRSISDNTLDSNTFLRIKIPKEDASLDWKETDNRNSSRQQSEAHMISEGDTTNRAISDRQLLRQGDGREARDRTRMSKVDFLTCKDDDGDLALQSPPTRDAGEDSQREHSRNKLFKDFGQMFPSSENFLLMKSESIAGIPLAGHSIGVQTGDSLLNLLSSPRESNGSISSRPSSDIASDRKYEDASSASFKTKKSFSRSESRRDKDWVYDEHGQASGVSDRDGHTDVSEEGKTRSSRPNSGRGEKRYYEKRGGGGPISHQFDGKVKRSSKNDKEGNKEASARDGNKHTSNRNGKNRVHRSASSSRAGTEKGDVRHNKDGEIFSSSRPLSRDAQNRHKVERSTGELFSSRFKRQESKHIKDDKNMRCSSRSEKRLPVDHRTEATSGSGSEKKSFGKLRSGDSSMPEPSRNCHSGSESETLSRIGSARYENDIISDDCRSETSSKDVSRRKEFQNTDRVMNNPLIMQGTKAKTDKGLRRTQEREKYIILLDQQNSEPSSQENSREKASESSDFDHTRPSIAVIPPVSQGVGAEEQILMMTKSISGSLMKLSRNKGVTEPSAGSSAMNESLDALKNCESQSLFVYSNQTQSDGNTTDDLNFDKIALRPKNKAVAEQRIIRHKEPVRFDVFLDNKENLYQRHPQRTENHKTTETILLMGKSKKNLTLKEALEKARPDYIREASDRRALIRLKQEMRQDAQNRNHQVVAQIPANLQTPSTLQRFLYKSDLEPLFSYKDIREQNRRLYQLLPESGVPGVKQRRSAQNHTNQLMARLYSQRLRKKVLSGQVSHAHKEVVTPIVSRMQRRN